MLKSFYQENIAYQVTHTGKSYKMNFDGNKWNSIIHTVETSQEHNKTKEGESVHLKCYSEEKPC